MDLEISYHVRKFGHRYITDIKERIFIKNDSTELELKQKIDWYFEKYIDNVQIIEYHDYKIKK